MRAMDIHAHLTSCIPESHREGTSILEICPTAGVAVANMAKRLHRTRRACQVRFLKGHLPKDLR